MYSFERMLGDRRQNYPQSYFMSRRSLAGGWRVAPSSVVPARVFRACCAGCGRWSEAHPSVPLAGRLTGQAHETGTRSDSPSVRLPGMGPPGTRRTSLAEMTVTERYASARRGMGEDRARQSGRRTAGNCIISRSGLGVFTKNQRLIAEKNFPLD